jgi:hypothetical protein
MMNRYNRKVGDVCRDVRGNWYVIHRIGPEGGTYGPRFYGAKGTGTEYGSLNTNTDVIKPEDLGDGVVAALALFSLTGKQVVSKL